MISANKFRMADCHPDRRHWCRGMCAECYGKYKLSEKFVLVGRVPTRNTCGHPDRKHVGHGMCGACYSRHLRATDPKYSKEVRRDEEMRRRYGFGVKERDEMIEAQGGVCEICKTPLGELTKPHIDHCHETGVVRGILCFKCNRALGMCGDNAEGLRKYLEYVERPR